MYNCYIYVYIISELAFGETCFSPNLHLANLFLPFPSLLERNALLCIIIVSVQTGIPNRILFMYMCVCMCTLLLVNDACMIIVLASIIVIRSLIFSV